MGEGNKRKWNWLLIFFFAGNLSWEMKVGDWGGKARFFFCQRGGGIAVCCIVVGREIIVGNAGSLSGREHCLQLGDGNRDLFN